MTVKFGLGVGFDPLEKVKKSKFVVESLQTNVRHYSDSSPKNFFVMVCRLSATPVFLLCLYTFKQSFNESMLLSL